MESALMMVPPSSSASFSASADLPLAVAPARRMALGLVTGRELDLGGDENQLAQLRRGRCGGLVFIFLRTGSLFVAKCSIWQALTTPAEISLAAHPTLPCA